MDHLSTRYRWKPAWISLLLGLLVLPGWTAGPITPLPPVTEADGRLGTCFSFYDGPVDRTAQAYAAGSRWDRFDFRWDKIEAQRGNFIFGPHEQVVARDLTHGLAVVGILWATPDWAGCGLSARATPPASSGPGGFPRAFRQLAGPEARVPCNLNLAWNHPDNVWGAYVYQVVSHFKEQGVHAWEIWNEPDNGGFWAGTAQEYAQLLKVGYLAAKAADPTATVIMGGHHIYWYSPNFYEQVLVALKNDPEAAAYHGFFDVISFHLYSNVNTPYDISRQIHAAVTANVGAHPLWLTEVGVPIWDEATGAPYPYAATAEEAAAYVIQAYASARAAGVERFFFFRLHDDYANMHEQFGLTRDDGSLRPAYVAYQVAARYLRGENQVTGPLDTGGGRRITFWGTPYGRVDVLWNTTTAPLTYTRAAVLPTATLVNLRGETQTLTAINSAYQIALPAATRSVSSTTIGGAPFLLLQIDTEPPTSTLSSRPTYLNATTLTLTWAVTDTLSGYWYEELQRAPTPTGTWTTIAGFGQTNGQTAITTPLPSGTAWYFRARARDNAGNWEAWPAEPELILELTRTLYLSATAFSDANHNALWDVDEPALVTTTFSLEDAAGQVVTQTLGAGWQLTQTLTVGRYYLTVSHADHFSIQLPLAVQAGDELQIITATVGLRPILARLYLPLTLRATLTD